jgi:hypothetical protein
MARSRSCRACRGWHDLAKPWPFECISHFGVIPRPAPNIRTDGMDPVRSMVSGQMFDSRSAYYREVRQAGCEIVGDDRAGFGKPPGYQAGDLAGDIKATIAELSQGS